MGYLHTHTQLYLLLAANDQCSTCFWPHKITAISPVNYEDHPIDSSRQTFSPLPSTKFVGFLRGVMVEIELGEGTIFRGSLPSQIKLNMMVMQ